MKYFMEESLGDGCVYPLQEFTETLNDIEDLKEIKLLEMKRDYGGEMWCKKFQEFPEFAFCGLGCQGYNPCNGKSGKCRHLVNGFVETGRKFILTKFGLKEITVLIR